LSIAVLSVALALLLLVLTGYTVWLAQMNRAKTRSLRQARDELRLAIDTIPTMAWSLLPDGRLDFLNRRWLEFSGMSLEQGLREAGATVHPEERRRSVAEWTRQMASGEAYETEMRLRRADGEYRWCLVRTVPLKDGSGKVVKWYGTSTDIHDRKCAEQAVQESRRLLQSMLETLPVGVGIMEPGGDLAVANGACRRIWGAPPLMPGPTHLLRSRGYWHGTAQRLEAGDWAGALALREGRIVQDQMIDIEAFDGQRKTIQNSAAPIRNAQGAIVGAVVVIEEVSGRVAADKALRESAHLLHHLSRRLFAVQEEERRHLARELHDEFGQLLTALSVRLQIAKGASAPAAWPALDDCAALVERAGERVRGLAIDLHPTMLESAGLDGTLRWLAEQHSREGRVAVRVSGEVGRIPGDVGITAFRVVQEALTNVLRHSQAKNASIRLEHSGERLLLDVEDDGDGFDVAATRERAAAQGHMGLVGMKERVEILGGELAIDSRPGSGTRVRLSLPLRAGV
jgi:PAS domain S-box-containing protein